MRYFRGETLFFIAIISPLIYYDGGGDTMGEKVMQVLQLLHEGKRREEIAEFFGYGSRKALDNFMRRSGFVIRDNIYVLQDGETPVIHKESKNKKINPVQTKDVVLQHHTAEVIQECDKTAESHTSGITEGNTGVIELKIESHDKLLYLLDKLEVLQLVIQSYENTGEVKGALKIDLPIAKDQRITSWVNSKVWSDFGKFCDKKKEHTKKDMLSLALKEFMDKYK